MKDYDEIFTYMIVAQWISDFHSSHGRNLPLTL